MASSRDVPSCRSRDVRGGNNPVMELGLIIVAVLIVAAIAAAAGAFDRPRRAARRTVVEAPVREVVVEREPVREVVTERTVERDTRP